MDMRQTSPRGHPWAMNALSRTLVVLMLTVMVGVASGPAFAQRKSGSDDQVRFALSFDDTNLTPYTYLTYQNLTLVWDTLFWHDLDNNVVPWMVKSFDVSDDGITWDLTLHEGLKWHDGVPVTAKDVKFTFDYVKQREHGRWTGEVANVASVETEGELDVTIVLSEPSATFAFQPLADLPIMPKHIFEEIENPEGATEALPVGSGPFRVVQYTPGQAYRLQAVDDYFKGPPAVSEIVAPIIDDASAMFLALKAGDVDATYRSVPPGQIGEFEGRGFKIARGTGYGTFRLLFNLGRPGPSVQEVRQAVALAVDQQELVDTVLNGFGTPGNPGFVHPASEWANPDLEADHDPEAARALLDDAGIVDSDGDGVREADGTPLSFEVLVYSSEPDRVRAGELMAEMVADVGIELTVQPLEFETVDDRVDRGDYELAILWLTPPFQTDPDSLRRLFASDGDLNRMGYANPEFDALAAEQRIQVDEDKRRAMVLEMQEMLAEDVPTLVFYHSDLLYPYRPTAISEWAFTKGVGIYDKTALLESVSAAESVPTDVSGRDEGGGAAGGVVAVVVALLVALAVGGGALAWRRAKSSAEQ